LAPYLDASGTLRLVVAETRSQLRNRQIAVLRFRELLRRALQVRRPRRATRPSAVTLAARLEEKRRRAVTKRLRQPPAEE
jgi:ribosome-associated protein